MYGWRFNAGPVGLLYTKGLAKKATTKQKPRIGLILSLSYSSAVVGCTADAVAIRLFVAFLLGLS